MFSSRRIPAVEVDCKMACSRSNLNKRLLFFFVLLLIYLGIFSFLCSTPYYDVTGTHNDRLFSADDTYYVTEFFSAEPDDSLRIIKHPLLILFGWLFTKAELFVFGAISLKQHYELIVLCQIFCSLLSTVYLDLLLERDYGLKTLPALLLCAIYGLAFSTLFYTMIAESYIVSSLLLLMTFYYSRRSMPLTILLGMLTAGWTITNAILWALIVLFQCGNHKKTWITFLLSGAGFCILMALLPTRGIFYPNIISGALSSAGNYSDHFDVLPALQRVMFVFFGSTTFFLDTAPESPFGEFQGSALSFLPSASPYIVAAMVLWMALLFYSILRNRKNRLLYAPAAVLGANLMLHGLIQYGLKEGFLYSLHHLSAQILIVALLFSGKPETQRPTTVLLGVYLAFLVLLNLPGYGALVTFFWSGA